MSTTERIVWRVLTFPFVAVYWVLCVFLPYCVFRAFEAWEG